MHISSSLYIPVALSVLILCIAQCTNNTKLKNGKALYQRYCVNCHGVDGKLATNGAIDLSHSNLSLEGRKEIVKNGRVTMMGFAGVLTESQIDSVVQYTLKLQK